MRCRALIRLALYLYSHDTGRSNVLPRAALQRPLTDYRKGAGVVGYIGSQPVASATVEELADLFLRPDAVNTRRGKAGIARAVRSLVGATRAAFTVDGVIACQDCGKARLRGCRRRSNERCLNLARSVWKRFGAAVVVVPASAWPGGPEWLSVLRALMVSTTPLI